jgi:hypothetical protein
VTKPIDIVVGRGGPYDPVVGATDCPMPAFAGQQLWIEKIGYGTYDYDKYQELSGGGFRLLGVGNTFVADEKWVVHFTGLSYGTGQTSYTNGFNFSQVISALFGRVGWKQPSIAGSPVLSSVNTTSKGGRYFNSNGFHALVTVQNIKNVMEEINASDSSLNAYLEALQRAVILRALNGVFDEPEYITQQLLYNSAWTRNDQPITNAGKFVGVEIRVPPTPGIAVQIDSVALYFDSDATFNLYVFNDSKKAPLTVIEVTTIANSQTVINLPDIVLNHIGGSNLSGGFYIGYFQDDIGGAKAIWEQGCPQFKASYYWSFIESDKKAGEYDFNRGQIGRNNISYGINLHVSTFRDHTWQIVKKAFLFDNVIGLQMAACVIEEILYSTRSNSGERILKDAAQVNASIDLTGVAPISDGPANTIGLRKKIDQELARLKKSFFPKPKSQTINLC